jgi:hypothetical protein
MNNTDVLSVIGLYLKNKELNALAVSSTNLGNLVKAIADKELL